MLRRVPVRSAVCGLLAAVSIAWCAGPALAVLPDGRGYELASPTDKQGGDVMPMTSRTRASADGSAVGFTSLVGFGDVHGATIGTEYIAQRTGQPRTSGWSTHGITPKEEPFPLFGAFFAAMDPGYDGEMSDDLSHGVFRAYRPLTDAPNVAGALNLYVRNDLRTTGEGFYQLISDPGFAVPASSFPSLLRPFVAAASSDFSHVIFESSLNLSADASGSDAKLYEWADGTLRLAGILPDGSAAPSSQAGQGASHVGGPAPTPRMISADGSRVFFQAPIGSGNVYMRINGTTTVQLNTSEKSVRESPQGASLWTASADGSRIFFSTTEGLVDGDDDASSDFYMYDVNASAGHHLTLVSRDENLSDGHSVIGAAGASADGHYLYFTMSGQLVAGEPELHNQRGLYAWHDGVLRYIGLFDHSADSTLNDLTATWIANSTSLMARVSQDGTHLMFGATSDAGFRDRWGFPGFEQVSAACPSGCRELYVFDADAGQLRCASCDPSGATPTGEAQDNFKPDALVSAVASTSHVTRALSDDGRFAFFSSPDALVPGDVNGRIDAYEYDTVTGRVALLSSGRSSDDSYLMDASASGRDAFFVTRERLTGWDTDTNYDLYDARVGGGVPDPVAPPPGCSGDSCQGAGSVAPAVGVSASRGFDGKGDLFERLRARHAKKRCKHGFRRAVRRGRVRCVRKAHRRAHRSARAAVIGSVSGGLGR